MKENILIGGERGKQWEDPVGLSTAEKAVNQVLKELLDWAIGVKVGLEEKKVRQKEIKPQDIQNQAVIGGKLKVFQQFIDKVCHLKEAGFD